MGIDVSNDAAGVVDSRLFGDEEPELDGEQHEAAFAAPAGSTKKPHKPFPILWVAGGAGVLMLALLSFAGWTFLSHRSEPADQMTEMPQPRIQSIAQQQQQQQQQPQMQQVVPVQPPLPPQNPSYGQGQGVPGIPQQPAEMAAQSVSTLQSTSSGVGNYPPQSVQASQHAPALQAAVPVAQTQQEVQTSPQPPLNSAPTIVQPVAPSQAASPQQGMPATQTQAQDPQSRAQPLAANSGRVPVAAPDIAKLQSDVAALTKQLKEIRSAMDSRAPVAPKSTKSTKPAKAIKSEDAEASTDTPVDESKSTLSEGEAEDATPAPTKRPAKHAGRKGRAGKSQVVEAASRDDGYTLTGAIGNRAFVSRKGGSDVNGDMSLVAGDTLDDGRKVLMVDAKNKKVWLSGNKFISIGDSAPQ